MLMQQVMKLMPEMEMIGMMESSRTVAWLVHFMAGTVPCGAFVASGTGVLLLGVIGWFVAMVG